MIAEKNVLLHIVAAGEDHWNSGRAADDDKLLTAGTDATL